MLLQLPPEIAAIVLSLLPDRTLLSIRLVSKAWRDIIEQQDKWRLWCRDEGLALETASDSSQGFVEEKKKWFTLFLKHVSTIHAWTRGNAWKRVELKPSEGALRMKFIKDELVTAHMSGDVLNFSADGTIPRQANPRKEKLEPSEEQAVVSMVACNDCVWTGAMNGDVCCWDMRPDKPFALLRRERNVEGNSYPVMTLGTNKIHLLAGRMNGHVDTYRADPDDTLVVSLPPHDAMVVCCAITEPKDGQPAFGFSGSNDLNLNIYNLDTCQLLYKAKGHADCITTLCLPVTRNGFQILSGGDDKSIRLWSCTTPNNVNENTVKCEVFMQRHTDWVYALRLLPINQHVQIKGNFMSSPIVKNDQYFLSSSVDLSICMWSLEKRECLYVLSGHRTIISGMEPTCQGRFLVTVSEADNAAEIMVWNLLEGKLMYMIRGPKSRILCNAATNKSIAAAAMGNVSVWSIVTPF
eukprot:m.257687 g.257687  ORF g.257687 m.257687 type:complete len:466 (+) comp16191_c1_seq19:164-1561(+)